MVTNNSKNNPTGGSGKFLLAGTAGTFSNCTYPSTSGATGTILRSNGTNFVNSTATFPDTAGTSGNLLTSDGTNWISSATVAQNYLKGWLAVAAGNPADSTTYYFGTTTQTFTAFTAIDNRAKIYIPIACTLNRVTAVFASSADGTTENCTLAVRVNDSSNTNVSTTIQISTASTTVTATTLGLSLSAGDYISFIFICPAWSSNPTNVSANIGWST